MSKKEQEDDEEEEFFIPNQDLQEQILKNAEKRNGDFDNQIARLKAIAKRKELRIQKLENQHRYMKGAEDGYILYIEQMRARKQPWWWFVLLIISFICILGQWDKGSIMLAFANILAHKLLWRRMYVETNVPSQFLSICIMAWTFVFG